MKRHSQHFDIDDVAGNNLVNLTRSSRIHMTTAKWGNSSVLASSLRVVETGIHMGFLGPIFVLSSKPGSVWSAWVRVSALRAKTNNSDFATFLESMGRSYVLASIFRLYVNFWVIYDCPVALGSN